MARRTTPQFIHIYIVLPAASCGGPRARRRLAAPKHSGSLPRGLAWRGGRDHRLSVPSGAQRNASSLTPRSRRSSCRCRCSDGPPADEDTSGNAARPDDEHGSLDTVVSVHPGQTVGDIFQKNGVNPACVLAQLLGDSANATALRNIHPGDEFAFRRDAEGNVGSLRFRPRRAHARRGRLRVATGMRQRIIDRLVERRTPTWCTASCRARCSMPGRRPAMDDAMAKIKACLTPSGYDIDFAQDLRVGDSFTVICDDLYLAKAVERLR